MEVEMRHEINLEVEGSQKLLLLAQDVFSWDSFVSDLVRNDLGVQREDVLVFGSKVHRGDTNAMHIFVLESLTLLANSDDVFVENLSGQEISAGRALEGGAHFYHPVHHLGSVLFRNLMAHDWNGHSSGRLVLTR